MTRPGQARSGATNNSIVNIAKDTLRHFQLEVNIAKDTPRQFQLEVNIAKDTHSSCIICVLLDITFLFCFPLS